jgi:hypothetical protein
MGTVEERLERIERLLASLVEREQRREWYTTEQFAALVGRAELTVRAWCRLGRVRAKKLGSGRGAHLGWAVSHEELLRFRREGLLPLRGGAA